MNARGSDPYPHNYLPNAYKHLNAPGDRARLRPAESLRVQMRQLIRVRLVVTALLLCAAGMPAHAATPAHPAAALSELYERRHGAPLWSAAGKPTASARAALEALRAAPDYGLRAEDYRSEALAAELAGLATGPAADSAQWQRFDADLSGALLRFLNDLHFGRVDPHAAGFDMPTRRDGFDPLGVLERLATASDPGPVIAAVEPDFLHYRLLRQSLPRYRQLAAGEGLPALPPLPATKVTRGQIYAGAPALRRLLAALGDLPPAEAERADPMLDEALSTALRRFQFLHGLTEDGTLGRGTLAALRVPLAQRVRQIELTLERWRWLPPLQPPTIMVNIPQFRLFLFGSRIDSEAGMLRMNVIVGQQYSRLHTPVFTADMKTIVFRPYWDVPPSITRHELLPRLRRQPHYLESQNMEIVGGGGIARASSTPTPEELAGLSDGRLRLRQRPGPDNALGLIKFVLPNPYDVYLHSTPAGRLFAEPRRAFSHGCVRVNDPVALATEVLRGTPGEWTAEKIREAMQGDATFSVKLARPVHVLILYGTAVASEDGAVHFFDDIYGHDLQLEALLGLKPVAGAH